MRCNNSRQGHNLSTTRLGGIHPPGRIPGREKMLNLIERNPAIGVLFSDENIKAAAVHDLHPREEERRQENLERIFGNGQSRTRRKRRRG